jgi:hypothetical protein
MGESVERGRYDLNASGEVGEFIERLASLRPDAWLGAVSTPDNNAGDVSVQNLNSLISRTGRAIDAWSATDAVETAAHIAFGGIASDKRFEAKRASAIRTARHAALGLLFRSELSPEDFERLYQPFGKLIPLSDLAEAASATARSH